jgi:hypothetical protein
MSDEPRDSRPRKHDHKGAAVVGESLLTHLVSHHGWTEGMVKRRGELDGGAYAQVWHLNTHDTAKLDPPEYWKN